MEMEDDTIVQEHFQRLMTEKEEKKKQEQKKKEDEQLQLIQDKMANMLAKKQADRDAAKEALPSRQAQLELMRACLCRI